MLSFLNNPAFFWLNLQFKKHLLISFLILEYGPLMEEYIEVFQYRQEHKRKTLIKLIQDFNGNTL